MAASQPVPTCLTMQVDDPMHFASGAPQIPMAVMGLVVHGGRMLPRLTKGPRMAPPVTRGQLVRGLIGAAQEALRVDQLRDRRCGQRGDLPGLSLVSETVLAEKHMAGSEGENRDGHHALPEITGGILP